MRHSIFCQHLLNHIFKNHLCLIQDEYFPCNFLQFVEINSIISTNVEEQRLQNVFVGKNIQTCYFHDHLFHDFNVLFVCQITWEKICQSKSQVGPAVFNLSYHSPSACLISNYCIPALHISWCATRHTNWFAGCQENIANQLKIHKMTFFENILGTYLIYQFCNETVDHCLTSSF